MVKTFVALPLLVLPLQVLGSGSDSSVQGYFASSYSCGVKDDVRGILECYDLGNNMFSTRRMIEDSCEIYVWRGETGLKEETGFYSLPRISHCMDSLLKPVSAGKEAAFLIASLENKVISSE
ncbi:hypothetical protein HZA98_02620 [Candidatus Woesearchaeota archaeon]|nr:hypothetical protein [Candidatus Woesearchaeota archaeon]